MAQTHPDRLASIATLLGMVPPPIANCRVLEVGCGTGENLIPMAHYLPESRFTGIDLDEEAIAEGRRFTSELELTNLELLPLDLRDAGASLGEFDYIIAHGVYSWIPAEVRDALLAFCRERLAPQGLAYISYNCLPGRHVPIMLREMMLHQMRDCSDSWERIARARDMLRGLSGTHRSAAWNPMIDAEIERMLTLDAGHFFHDDLSPVNDSFYLHEFVAQAARHSLQYLGDADAHLMLNSDGLAGDVVERDQYLDFLDLRRFRQTLLCHAEVKLDRPVSPERLDQFLFSSPARLSGDAAEQEPEARLAAVLREAYPLPVPFAKLLEQVGDRKALRGILFPWICSGFAKLHIYDFASGRLASERPLSSRLARWESLHTGVLTYSTHTVLTLDGIVQSLIDLMDGTRDFDSLVAGLMHAEGAPSASEIRQRLPGILARFARLGLLASPSAVGEVVHEPSEPRR